MLRVERLQASYGRSQVLFDIALEVADGEVVTLLGRNGMGKTTTIRSLMGLMAPHGGEILFQGVEIRGKPPEAIARRGVGLVPEGRQVFPTLSVRENLVATAGNRLRRDNPWTLARVFALFPILETRQNQSARTLSGGEQQMLAIGRALMTNPTLLILDEATEGLAPVIRRQIWDCLRILKGEGQSILLVDKNIEVLKRLADRHFVIEKGRTVWSGTSSALEQEADMVHRFIGV